MHNRRLTRVTSAFTEILADPRSDVCCVRRLVQLAPSAIETEIGSDGSVSPMNRPESQFRHTATRVFWFVATGVAAILLAPEIAYDVGRGLAYAPDSSVLLAGIFTFACVAMIWLVMGTLCGLAMEQQPWHRNLYLLVTLVLCLLFYRLVLPGID